MNGSAVKRNKYAFVLHNRRTSLCKTTTVSFNPHLIPQLSKPLEAVQSLSNFEEQQQILERRGVEGSTDQGSACTGK